MKEKLKKRHNNRGILNNITTLIEKRKNLNINTEIIWVPSHTQEGKKLTNNMKRNMAKLKKRFNIDEIVTFNKIADDYAKEGTTEINTLSTVPGGADNYVMIIKNRLFEGKITKIITEIDTEKFVNLNTNTSNIYPLDSFDMKQSNKILYSNTIKNMSLSEFIRKLRMNTLETPFYKFYQNNNKDDNVLTTSNKIIYNNPTCEKCKE